MLNGIIEASRGCLKEEIRMGIISSNLANSSVAGFKKDRVSFKEMLQQAGKTEAKTQDKGNDDSDSLLLSIQTDMSQGNMRSTGNDLDLAILGKGFFKVETPDGIRFTRKGTFILDKAGTLTTYEGYKVMGDNGPIKIDGSLVNIGNDGGISVDGKQSGKIKLVDFEDYGDLMKEGNGLFLSKSNNPGTVAPSETIVKQKYLELSNVNPVEDMVQMIHCVREFESYKKSIQILDDLNKKAINEVGRLR